MEDLLCRIFGVSADVLTNPNAYRYSNQNTMAGSISWGVLFLPRCNGMQASDAFWVLRRKEAARQLCTCKVGIEPVVGRGASCAQHQPSSVGGYGKTRVAVFSTFPELHSAAVGAPRVLSLISAWSLTPVQYDGVSYASCGLQSFARVLQRTLRTGKGRLLSQVPKDGGCSAP